MLVWDDGKTITSSDVIYQCKVIERMYMYADKDAYMYTCTFVHVCTCMLRCMELRVGVGAMFSSLKMILKSMVERTDHLRFVQVSLCLMVVRPSTFDPCRRLYDEISNSRNLTECP
jgi:hypothetical protein